MAFAHCSWGGIRVTIRPLNRFCHGSSAHVRCTCTEERFMNRRFRNAALALLAILTLTPGAWAQGCILCYTSLAGANPGAIRAFQLAMFVLLIAALLLFVSIF